MKTLRSIGGGYEHITFGNYDPFYPFGCISNIAEGLLSNEQQHMTSEMTDDFRKIVFERTQSRFPTQQKSTSYSRQLMQNLAATYGFSQCYIQ